jgi:glycine C-acetyltransferase
LCKVDIFKKIEGNQGPLGQYSQEAHGYFTFPKLEGEIGPRMKFRGREVLNWSLNNYIGLANHPEVRKADTEATEKWGLAYPMGARMMSGQTSLHEQLENQLSEFVKKEDAYLLNFGYQGMVSIIDTLCGRNDVIVYDSDAHACIIDGMRLHIGKRFVYQHNNMESLEKQLARACTLSEKQGGGVLVITEGVFGMSGVLGQLDEIVALKQKYEFRLLVDDAHGFGTMGPTGAGTAEHFGVLDQVDLYFATFAKAMALIGGFVAGKESIINFLRYNMRSQIYAKSLPMPIVEGAIKRLELLRTRPELRQKLWTVVNALQEGLRAKGFDTGKTKSMVTPVYLSGSVPEATNLVMDLRENYNLFCSIVVYPVIPKGQLLLRLIPTAIHSLEDVEYTINAFSEIRTNLESGKYNTDTIANINSL